MPSHTPTPSDRAAPRFAMTVDVEDYYHVSAFEKAIPTDDWGRWPSRVERNTHWLLDLFDRHRVQATFFVLGWVAERQRDLVAEIAKRGHEIASHGYSHRLVYNQTPAVFRDETLRSKNLLEDITQQSITGYRAASYSITRRSLWALDILAELGFTWDSSIFPVRHDRYGIPDSPTAPYQLTTPSGRKLMEIPLTTAQIGPVRLPAAGGGYFRLYPYWVSRALLKRAAVKSGSAIFYLHPWEIDPEQPRVPGASALSRFRHYNNLDRCPARLARLLEELPFTSVRQLLASAESKPVMEQFSFAAA